MPKKNAKQQQKRQQKKREKRQSRPVRLAAVRKPQQVSWAYLESCWTKQELPAPPELQQELSKFDAMASAVLETELSPGELPSRLDLALTIEASLMEIFSEANSSELLNWLTACCENPEQKQRIENTLAALEQADWQPEVATLNFLLQKWSADLPPQLSRWLPLWTDLYRDVEWPSLPDETWSKMAEESQLDLSSFEPAVIADPAEQTALLENDEERIRFSELYELIMSTGQALAWAPTGQEFFQDLAKRTVWHWARKNLDQPVASRALRVATAVGAVRHPLLLLCSMANDICASITTVVATTWEDFVLEPGSPYWAIELGYRLEDARRIHDAYDLFKQIAERNPQLFAVHEYLARIAIEMHLPRETVEAHIERGLEVIEKLSQEEVDPEIMAECKTALLSHRTAPAV